MVTFEKSIFNYFKALSMKHVKISIVVSVFNEEEMIGIFWDELNKEIISNKQLSGSCELIFVNDGSTDNSASLLDELATTEKNVKVIHFSRNFGHESTMYAGISHAAGDAVVCMDSDLQHPPSCLAAMMEAYCNGAEVVTMRKTNRRNESMMMKIASGLFYRLLNQLSDNKFEPDASDFFLISRRVAGIIANQYNERTRFLRGLIQSVGFKKESIGYVTPKRPAGTSKYSFTRLFFLSLSALASFSHIPLRLGLGIGVVFGLLSFITGIYSVIMYFSGDPVSGYTTIVVLLSFGFSLLFIVTGITGEYIGYLFNEVKNRPLYIIDRISEQKTGTVRETEADGWRDQK